MALQPSTSSSPPPTLPPSVSPSASASSLADEPQDIFEINDFTSASPWEKFITDVEELYKAWSVSENRLPTLQALPNALSGLPGSPERFVSKILNLSETLLRFTLFFDAAPKDTPGPAVGHAKTLVEDGNEVAHTHLSQQIMSKADDFKSHTHRLGRWFGVRQYIIVTMANSAAQIMTANDCRLVLSSLTTAASNTRCALPLFVQIYEPWRHLFLGTCIQGTVYTKFDMINLSAGPPLYQHLSGMLDLFHSKLALPPSLASSIQVLVSARFGYQVAWWFATSAVGSQSPSSSGPAASQSGVAWLDWGCSRDPVTSLQVAVCWPEFRSDTLVDNAIHSDFSVATAPVWTCRAVTIAESGLTDAVMESLVLTTSLHSFVKCCKSRESFDALLTALAAAPGPSTTAAAAGPKPAHDAAAVHSHVSAVLSDLFARKTPAELQEAMASMAAAGLGAASATPLKGAPRESLVYSLAMYVAVLNSHAGLPAVAYLWREFVRTVRRHWEALKTIPQVFFSDASPSASLPVSHILSPSSSISVVTPYGPDMNSSLLYQKLQMLNYCIARKLKMDEIRAAAREEEQQHQQNPGAKFADPAPLPSDRSNCEENDSDDGDEFFLAPEDEQEMDDAPRLSPSGTAAAPEPPVRRQGALRDTGLRMKTNRLPIHVPMTQEPAPMTEDMIYEHQHIVMQLSESEEGLRIRARMQAASLLSDMEAFKAANPGCCLEDFVRWHSPRDWIVDASEDGDRSGDDDPLGTKGRLSSRMLQGDSLWHQVWEQARAIPVGKQRPLFDFTKEAEKVLHYLENMHPSAFMFQLLPCVFDAALRSLHSSLSLEGSATPAHVSELLERVEQSFVVLGKELGSVLASALAAQTPTGNARQSSSSSLITFVDSTLSNFASGWSSGGSHSLGTSSAALSAFSSSTIQNLSLTGQSAVEACLGSLQQLIAEAELRISCAESLLAKFPSCPELARLLASGKDVELSQAHRSIVCQLLIENAVRVPAKAGGGSGPGLGPGDARARADHDNGGLSSGGGGSARRYSDVNGFPAPDSREFILRAFTPRPLSAGSRYTAQRMHCLVGEGEFRVCGAFSLDALHR